MGDEQNVNSVPQADSAAANEPAGTWKRNKAMLGCLGAVVACFAILAVCAGLFGGVPSAVQKVAEQQVSRLSLSYGTDDVQLFKVASTENMKGDAIANEYTAIYYITGAKNVFGTQKKICVNVFLTYDPNSKTATVAETREVRNEWE